MIQGLLNLNNILVEIDDYKTCILSSSCLLFGHVLHFKLRQNWSSLDCFDKKDAVFHPDDQHAYHQEEDQHGQGPL